MEKKMEPLELKMAKVDPRPCPHCDKPQYKNYLRHEPKCPINPANRCTVPGCKREISRNMQLHKMTHEAKHAAQ